MKTLQLEMKRLPIRMPPRGNTDVPEHGALADFDRGCAIGADVGFLIDNRVLSQDNFWIVGGAKPVSRPLPIPPSAQRAHSQGGRTLARGGPARQGPGRAMLLVYENVIPSLVREHVTPWKLGRPSR